VSVAVDRVRRGFYADSVALMRISRGVSSLPGVEEASLMIGTPSNRELLENSGLIDAEGRKAQADDLIIAVRAKDRAAALAGLDEAEKLLAGGQAGASGSGVVTVRRFASALEALPQANLTLISVPGEFAAAEARRALEHGLHVMMFSDNVPIALRCAMTMPKMPCPAAMSASFRRRARGCRKSPAFLRAPAVASRTASA